MELELALCTTNCSIELARSEFMTLRSCNQHVSVNDLQWSFRIGTLELFNMANSTVREYVCMLSNGVTLDQETFQCGNPWSVNSFEDVVIGCFDMATSIVLYIQLHVAQ